MPSTSDSNHASSTASDRERDHESESEPQPQPAAQPARPGNPRPDAAISLRGVTLDFPRYHDKTYSFKRAALDALLRRSGPPVVSTFRALDSVDLDIRPGERVGVVGGNGAGKSTLLRVVAGIYPPTAGACVVRGSVVPLIEMGAGFHAEMTGLENIRLNAALLGVGPREIRAKVDSILDFAGLREFAALPLKYYSSGMASRLAFAVATEVHPDILLIDEALSVGDAAFVERAKTRLRQLLDRSNVVVVVSHDPKALREICTRGVWLDRGRLRADGPVDEVIEAYLRNTR